MKTLKGALLSGMLAATVIATMPFARGGKIETTGEPGSPSATTTVGDRQLPPRDPAFGGVIKEKATQSKD